MSEHTIKFIKVQAGQTVADIAIQEYETVEGMILVIQANPDLTVTSQLVAGQDLIIWTNITVNTVKELIKTEPYASQLQNLLIQWATLISNGVTTTPNPPATGTDIAIPRLRISSANFRKYGEKFRIRDYLFAKWDQFDKSFLDYNPEVWSFRYNGFVKTRKKTEVTNVELLTNPSFQNSDSDWEVFYGVINTCYEVYGITPAGRLLRHDMVFEENKYYCIQFNVSGYASGNVRAGIGARESTSLFAESAGTYTGYVHASAGLPSYQLEFWTDNLETLNAFQIDWVSVKEVEGDWSKSIHKGWKHEPHLNGIKFPGSAYYSGSTTCAIPDIEETGRHTEFPFPEMNYSNFPGMKFEIPVDAWEYIFPSGSIAQKLNDESDFLGIHVRYANGMTRVLFSFAIVIDNPVANAQNPKLIGPLSDPIALRFLYGAAQSPYSVRAAFEKDNLWRKPPS